MNRGDGFEGSGTHGAESLQKSICVRIVEDVKRIFLERNLLIGTQIFWHDKTVAVRDYQPGRSACFG